MNIYLVRDTSDGKYLQIDSLSKISWVPRELCTVYTQLKHAQQILVYVSDWDDMAAKKYDIVHLVATAKVDESNYPKTLDGAVIELGKMYYYFNWRGVFAVYVNERTVQFNKDGDLEYLKVRSYLGKEVWFYSDDLYSTEPLAWAAWKEERAQ